MRIEKRNSVFFSAFSVVFLHILQGSDSQKLLQNFPYTQQIFNKNEKHFGSSFFPHTTDLDVVLENLIPFYLRHLIYSGRLQELPAQGLFTNVSEGCIGDSKRWMQEISSVVQAKLPATWALQMIDAWGKFPDGILSGHTSSPGDFEECIGIRADDTVTSAGFKGSYCSSYLVPNQLNSGAKGAERDHVGREYNFRQSAGPYEILESMFDVNGSVVMMPFVGTCFPSSCSQADSQQILTNAFAVVTNGTLAQMVVQCYTDEKPPFDAADFSVIAVLSVIGLLCVVGTLLDVTLVHQNIKSCSLSRGKERAYKYIVSFSVYTNTMKWLSTNAGDDSLGCLHGLRFFSMAWVVLCHTFTMVFIGFTWNMVDLKYMYKSGWPIYAILNGTPSVDTFFTLSGTLVAYNLLKALDKTRGNLNLPLLYFHRYVRLTPTYAMIVGMMATLLPYLSRGPGWRQMESESRNCEKYWWTNLLYINNVVTYSEDSGPCHGEAWYLANDMQFFWLSPLLVYPLWRWPKIGTGLFSLLSIVSMVTPGVIAHQKRLMPTVTFLFVKEHLKGLYEKPWTRIGPYLVGIFLGFILHSTKKREKESGRNENEKTGREIHKSIIILGWLLFTASAIAIIFGPQTFFDPANIEASTTSVSSAVYAGVHRYAWGVVISWIVWACCNGHGGFVNDFLSWKVFIPLGRLTFCVYITSYHLQKIYHLTIFTPVYFSAYNMVNLFFAHLVLALLVGFVFTITLESPFIQLEKLIFPQQGARPSSTQIKNSNENELVGPNLAVKTGQSNGTGQNDKLGHNRV